MLDLNAIIDHCLQTGVACEVAELNLEAPTTQIEPGVDGTKLAQEMHTRGKAKAIDERDARGDVRRECTFEHPRLSGEAMIDDGD